MRSPLAPLLLASPQEVVSDPPYRIRDPAHRIGDPALGRDVKINDLWCEVIGVLAPEPGAVTAVQGVPVSSTEREIYLPFTTALRKLDRDPMKSPLGEIVVRLEPKAPGQGRSRRRVTTAALTGTPVPHLPTQE